MKFWKSFPSLLLLTLLVGGCSLRDRTNLRGVKISVPQGWGSASKVQKKSFSKTAIKSGGELIPISDPTSFSEINCLAINVTGPGIVKDSRFSCGTVPSEVGISLGFIPVSQSEAEVLVPIGIQRKIQLIGIKSQADCLDFDFILANHLFETNAFTHSFVLAETTIDVFDDTSATLIASFDQSKVFMGSCGQNQNPTCVPGTVLDPSTNSCNNECSEGTVWDSSSKTCVSACGEGAIWDSTNGCTCAIGLNLDAQQNCISCPAGTTWNSGTKSCECNDQQCLDLSCGESEFIAGMNVRTGCIVDQYQLQCKKIENGAINDQLILGPSTGGTGGGEDAFICPQGSLLSQIKVGSDPSNWNGAVSFLGLDCKKLSGEITQTEKASYSKNFCDHNSANNVLSCPSGQFLYGIKALPMQMWGSYFTSAIYDIKCRAP
jgi:hypothetical protein